jgi:hypothetical protein
MRLPDREDFLDYAEGAAQSAEVQKKILKLLASSPLVREQLAGIKQDLYMVSSQIPDYAPRAEFGVELTKIAQAWTKIVYNRKFSLSKFHRSREFFGLLLFLVSLLLLILVGLGIQQRL